MKALTNIITLAAIIALPLTAMTAEPEKQPDTKIHKVVFEIAIDGAEQWLRALRNVENVQKALGAESTRIEVVSHGKGLGMLLAKTVSMNPDIKVTLEKLHATGVVFSVCENTMNKMQINKDQLVPFATTVDAGVSEVIRKQAAGYAYIKSGG
jgi:intracellular sulfur oxidation DsrE/DsrF family protein